MAPRINSVMSPNTPSMGNGATRWLGSVVLKSLGWKITGKLPDKKKILVIGVPHTSNLDFIVAMAAMQSVGLRMSYMMKKEAFVFPLAGFFKWLGGVPIDRSKSQNVTDQMVEWYNSNDNVWLGIAPEGTRSQVDSYKPGYLRIAYAAKVPVFIAGINGGTKEILLTKCWELTGDLEKDNEEIRAFCQKTFTGIRPERQ
ncbi:1-acyl-sn-glycerol-3-phosphate acyltransferase [Hirschia maritima]|uniref:1-acyl-sn-glycerol-3-phosphate acyltransferase n=1 Tax=Hirschia maritima TaxID=1121961 RepID=UPI00035CC96E|nr:1-acyl-sn-glycerol-3-phosphate acyltransferase [Hirschia maritima]